MWSILHRRRRKLNQLLQRCRGAGCPALRLTEHPLRPPQAPGLLGLPLLLISGLSGCRDQKQPKGVYLALPFLQHAKRRWPSRARPAPRSVQYSPNQRRTSSTRSCGSPWTESQTRNSLSRPGIPSRRARARAIIRVRTKARTPWARVGIEPLGAPRGRRLPQGAAGVRPEPHGGRLNGTVRVGFGAHKIWGS